MKVANSAEAQNELVVKTLKGVIIESRTSGSAGSYQPLGYYKKLGYDWRRIKRTCKDKKFHPNLGHTYRVDIDYQDKKKEMRKIREEILKSIRERKSAGQNGDGRGNGGPGGKGGGRGRGGGGKPPPPPAPTTATKKMGNDAVRILAKVSPITYAIKALQKHKKMSYIPQPHVDKLKECLAKMVSYESEAQKTVATQAVLNSNPVAVSAEASVANNHMALLQGMLASMP